MEDKIGICQYHQFSSCRHTAPSENLSSWHQDGYHTQGTSSRHPHEETKHRDLQTSCWSKGYEINLRQRQNANNCARLMWHCCYTYVYTLYLFFRCHSISAGKNRDTAVPAEGNGDLQFSRDHCCQGRSNPVARLWADTLGESWPPELISSYASIDFWCQLVVSPATTTSSWMKQSNTWVSTRSAADSKHGVQQQRKPCHQSSDSCVMFMMFCVFIIGLHNIHPWTVILPVLFIKPFMITFLSGLTKYDTIHTNTALQVIQSETVNATRESTHTLASGATAL